MKTIYKLLVFCLTLLSGTKSFAHTSYPDTVYCPIDSQMFVIYVTMSYTTFGSFKDFQKTGAIGDLYESYVNSCPKCHYSGYKSDIDTTFDENTKREILKILEPYQKDTMNDVIENEIAIEIHKYFKRDNDDIAELYLVASYFLRTKKEIIEKRKELQNNCILYFQKAIDANEYKTKKLNATIYYLIGDLYRRIGDFENSIKYFEIALKVPTKEKWLIPLLNEQKKLAEQKDENNNI